MNVYEEAHSLERAIRESEEYKQFDAAKKEIAEKPELETAIKDFEQKQIAVQAKQLMGEEVGPDVMESVQKLYGIISQDPVAAKYLQCEMRFSLMIQDVYKILSDVMGIQPPAL
jgi:cell fate (sporulation/competence/biofilm development) regulator YlbF (YheA/YmcA/DUF963 family)